MRLIDGDALTECVRFTMELKRRALDSLMCDEKSRHELELENEILQAILEFIEKAPTVGRGDMWIPVSRELPEDEYVLISKKPTMLSGDKWCVTIAIRMADPRSRKIQWRDAGFGVIQDDKVLAWMPLPKPYREDSEAE